MLIFWGEMCGQIWQFGNYLESFYFHCFILKHLPTAISSSSMLLNDMLSKSFKFLNKIIRFQGKKSYSFEFLKVIIGFDHAILLSLYSTRNLDLEVFFSVPRKQLCLESYKA